jgi:hypothetical protein
VAEQMEIRYVFAAYCPITLPSPHHAPPKVLAWTSKDATADNRTLWAEDPNAGTSAGVPLSTRIGHQPAWPRSLTCEATSSATSPG